MNMHYLHRTNSILLQVHYVLAKSYIKLSSIEIRGSTVNLKSASFHVIYLFIFLQRVCDEMRGDDEIISCPGQVALL